MTRDEVVQEARKWLGVRYRHAGRSREGGVDCVGLLVVVGRALGVPHEDIQHYTGWPDPQRRVLVELSRWLELCRPDEPYPGTIGVFNHQRQGLPCHVGIFAAQHGQTHLIHSMLQRRLVLEEPFAPDTGHASAFRLLRRLRFPGLET